MQVVVRHAGRVREIDLVVEGPDACVADLVGAVTGSAETGAGVALEGRFFGPDAGLDEIGLHEGALIDVTVAAPRPSPPPAGPALAVIGGPVSGALHSLPDDEVLIGRTLDCGVTIPDPTISAQHVRLRHLEDGSWEATDLGSHNGTWIDGSAAIGPTRVGTGSLLRLGASHVRVLGKLPDDRPLAVDPLFRASGGLVPFNRPPRPALPPEPLSEVAPEPPQQQRSGRAFSIIAFITPLLLGGAMIYFFRNPRFALFMLLSPLMLVGNWLTSRRQAKKERRVSSREFKEAMERLETHLRDAVTVETARREELLPDPAEIMRRAREPSTALWQRRPDDPDFLRLRAGIADVAWQPPVENPGQQARELPEQVATLVNRYAVLPRTPVEIDLSGGGVVGLVGDRDAALALARSLVCQAAVHHGPADCAMVVLARPHHAGDWDWAKWLPHVRDASGATRMLSGDPQTSAELLGSLLESAGDDDGGMFKAGQRQQPGGPTRLVVLDDTSLIEGRRAPARLVLSGKAGPVAGIVLAETVDQLPAVTSTVIELDSDLGNATLRRPQQGVVVAGLVVAGTTDVLARDCARCLARYEDPELEVPGAGLPSLVRLLPLLGMDEVDAAAVAKRWAEAGSEPAPRTPVGIGEDGIVSLNLVRDGPHGLIGGTTGSGKSELLRSLVAGLAAGTEPEHLVFVLVDYKGGSAFDECARLPHTVGMVTDLDEHLGERALRSLEAELSQRERTLRAAGTQDLPAYLQLGAPLGPLPRLLVVIDEFATLATELPDFLGALVGVAQRGRSLGVHLLLATQRPSGAVNANIKANTNLRIALRVQDDTDSTDIIDRRDAARISRANPGRAYVRLGPGDVLLVQSALSTARLGSGTASAGVRLAPFRFGPLPAPRDDDGVLSEQGPSDLQRLVVAVREAFHASGQSEPRKPWLQMLSEQIDLADILGRDDAGGVPVPLALADEPERQRQVPVGWDPAQGHLALFGMVGSGTSSALLAVARALASRHGPDDCHLYGLDFGTRRLAPLADLPHAGAVVGATETEAQYRVIRHLRRELDRRRTLSPDELDGEPLVVTIVDGVAALLAEFDSIENLETGDAFKRVFSDGPASKLVFVVSGDRPGALPLRLGSLVSQRYLFRLADPNDFSSVGVRSKQLPAFVPGRAIQADTRRVVQFGQPGDDVAGWSAQRPLRCAAVAIRSLPVEVAFNELHSPDAGPYSGAGPLCLTVGLADEDLGPAELAVHPTDHLTIAGPPRSGKSSALALLAVVVKRTDPDALVIAVADEHSPLREHSDVLDAAGSADFLTDVLRAAVSDERRWWILVDEAAFVDDPKAVFAGLARAKRPGLHVVAAGRTDDLRSGYGHWTRQLRQSRTGVLLQPNLSSDGDLFGLRLPRRLQVPLVTGRGFLVAGGDARLAQLARPPAAR